MRLLLILAIVCGIVYFTWHTFSTGKGIFATAAAPALDKALSNPTGLISGKGDDRKQELRKIVDEHISDNSQSSAAPTSQATTDTPPTLSSISPAVNPPPAQPPMSIVYRFANREVPPDSQIDQLKQNGVFVVSDRPSGSVVLSGPPEAVSAIHAALQALDLSAGSCGVQTWAVYVDQHAQKGFDLTAAIGAVTGLSSSFNVGSGTATLNLDAGSLTAALEVIADGSSVEVIQRPHVALMHGIPSTVESIQEVPLPAVAVSQGISQSSINYRKVGLQLTVTPYFLSRDAVRLSVEQTNGLIGSAVQIGEGTAPVIESQTVKTTVQLTIGQSVILGGVATDRLRTVRGLLRNTTERVHGALYVILSTFHDAPRAIPVSPPFLPAPALTPPAPFATPQESPADWIDNQLLPPRGWQSQERDFLRTRAQK